RAGPDHRVRRAGGVRSGRPVAGGLLDSPRRILMRRSGSQAVRRSGVTLVELLVVMVMLGLIIGGSALAFATLATPHSSEWAGRDRERTLAAADRLLTGLTLLNRQDLDRRLGRHPLGAFIVDIERPERTLYRIALAEERSPEVEELVTVVYRREARHAP